MQISSTEKESAFLPAATYSSASSTTVSELFLATIFWSAEMVAGSTLGNPRLKMFRIKELKESKALATSVMALFRNFKNDLYNIVKNFS